MGSRVFVFDGSNVAMTKDGTPSALLEAERALAAQYPGAEIVVVVDRSWIGWHRHNGTVDDQRLLDQFGDRGSRRWQPQPADTAADELILAIASARNGIVVSRDQFHDYQVRYPFLTEDGRRLAPAYAGSWVFTTALGTVADDATIAKKVAAEAAKRQSKMQPAQPADQPRPVVGNPPPAVPPSAPTARGSAATTETPVPRSAGPRPAMPTRSAPAASPGPAAGAKGSNETAAEFIARLEAQSASFRAQEEARAAADARTRRNDTLVATVLAIVVVIALLIWWLR